MLSFFSWNTNEFFLYSFIKLSNDGVAFLASFLKALSKSTLICIFQYLYIYSIARTTLSFSL